MKRLHSHRFCPLQEQNKIAMFESLPVESFLFGEQTTTFKDHLFSYGYKNVSPPF